MTTPVPLYKMMVLDTSQIIAPREDYQRELKSERVKRIVKSFDERIANEPKVSFRDGKIRYGVSTTAAGKSILCRKSSDVSPVKRRLRYCDCLFAFHKKARKGHTCERKLELLPWRYLPC